MNIRRPHKKLSYIGENEVGGIQKCKDICLQYKSKVKRYSEEVRRCSICCIFMKTTERYCPCCHNQLRVKCRQRFGRFR